VWLLPLALLAASLPVLLLIAAIAADAPRGIACTPTAPAAGTTTSGNYPTGREAAREVRVVQANLYTGMSAAEFASDLTQVLADQPDVVTLNETYTRTHAQLTPPGYDAWRAETPRDARETPVLWRTDTWHPVAQGTQLLHNRPVRWGTRYLNWVTLEATDGRRLSVISAHASPAGPGRAGLISEFIDRLIDVVASLRGNGPVVVGADLNLQYPHRVTKPGEGTGWLTTRLTSASITSTFDALGEPHGGWATGDRGATIDYLLTSGATPLTHATGDLTYSDHRLLAATLSLDRDGCPPAGASGVPITCPASGGTAEAGLTADALRVMRCVLTVFGPHPVGGVGSRPNPSDHPSGRAVDVMIPDWNTPAGKAEGWRIARWAQANAAALNITYVIFDARIWSTAHAEEGWRPYSHPTGASNPTLDHLDHVHISVIG
jgi:endonuclease/exonuclease/phosphatase (EEP) superfamily protein YafD